ncbi:hypothetical protein [Enterococcus hirae]|uniref:hypothetical protein n=1 Tax=Enterococcus hirae TaxID=1354 RepID=UPI0020738E32|nr:hypothetical protein [Enterococcus hirae]
MFDLTVVKEVGVRESLIVYQSFGEYNLKHNLPIAKGKMHAQVRPWQSAEHVFEPVMPKDRYTKRDSKQNPTLILDN